MVKDGPKPPDAHSHTAVQLNNGMSLVAMPQQQQQTIHSSGRSVPVATRVAVTVPSKTNGQGTSLLVAKPPQQQQTNKNSGKSVAVAPRVSVTVPSNTAPPRLGQIPVPPLIQTNNTTGTPEATKKKTIIVKKTITKTVRVPKGTVVEGGIEIAPPSLVAAPQRPASELQMGSLVGCGNQIAQPAAMVVSQKPVPKLQAVPQQGCLVGGCSKVAQPTLVSVPKLQVPEPKLGPQQYLQFLKRIDEVLTQRLDEYRKNYAQIQFLPNIRAGDEKKMLRKLQDTVKRDIQMSTKKGHSGQDEISVLYNFHQALKILLLIDLPSDDPQLANQQIEKVDTFFVFIADKLGLVYNKKLNPVVVVDSPKIDPAPAAPIAQDTLVTKPPVPVTTDLSVQSVVPTGSSQSEAAPVLQISLEKSIESHVAESTSQSVQTNTINSLRHVKDKKTKRQLRCKTPNYKCYKEPLGVFNWCDVMEHSSQYSRSTSAAGARANNNNNTNNNNNEKLNADGSPLTWCPRREARREFYRVLEFLSYVLSHRLGQHRHQRSTVELLPNVHRMDEIDILVSLQGAVRRDVQNPANEKKNHRGYDVVTILISYRQLLRSNYMKGVRSKDPEMARKINEIIDSVMAYVCAQFGIDYEKLSPLVYDTVRGLIPSECRTKSKHAAKRDYKRLLRLVKKVIVERLEAYSVIYRFVVRLPNIDPKEEIQMLKILLFYLNRDIKCGSVNDHRGNDLLTILMNYRIDLKDRLIPYYRTKAKVEEMLVMVNELFSFLFRRLGMDYQKVVDPEYDGVETDRSIHEDSSADEFIVRPNSDESEHTENEMEQHSEHQIETPIVTSPNVSETEEAVQVNEFNFQFVGQSHDLPAAPGQGSNVVTPEGSIGEAKVSATNADDAIKPDLNHQKSVAEDKQQPADEAENLNAEEDKPKNSEVVNESVNKKQNVEK